MAKDFYEILGVARTASEKEIRSAYRKLARKLHPDVNPNDKGSEARFKEVNAAYDVLQDADKRKKYDRYGENWEHADELDRAQAARARTGGGGRSYYYSRGGPGGEAGEDLDMGDLLGGLFGRRSRGRPRNLNLEQQVDITLEEAYHGTTRLLMVGTDTPGRRLEVRIPPGVTTGSRVRVTGEGIDAGDGTRGDLFLIVNVRTHDRFERKGDDLYVDVEAPLTTAVLGGEVTVQAVDKKVALTIPPLTQNGRTFRLNGLGMPKLNNQTSKGHLHARIKVRLPESLDDKQRELFEELKATGL